jgi:hypothetical protein
MENEIIKMVRKHPIASVLLVIALAVPYSIELFLSNWKNLVSIGISMVIGTSCLFSILAICLWGIVYLITVSIKNIMKKNKKNTWWKITNWNMGIAASAFAFVGWSFFWLFIVYLFSLSFKWFVFLTYATPCMRIIITSIQYIYYKRKSA